MTTNLFTTQEKVAISNVLIVLMNADNEISSGEILYLAQLKLVLGLSDDILNQAKQQDFMESLIAIKKMSILQKKTLTTMMFEMANADSHVCDNELKIMIVIAKICELPIAQLLN